MKLASREIVDWYQFRLTDVTDPGSARNPWWMWRGLFEGAGLHDFAALLQAETHTVESGYNYRFKHAHHFEDSGTIIYSGGHVHIIVALSGRACEYWRNRGMLDDIISKTHHLASRIDLARDIETELSPFDLTGDTGRQRTAGIYQTPSGQTAYLGSRKSDLMARVYKYNPPHPRAHLVRFEVEAKGKRARSVAEHVSNFGLRDLLANYHTHFGVLDPTGDLSNAVTLDLPMPAADRADNKTVWWLQTQVGPAVRRLLSEQKLTLDELLNLLLNEDESTPTD